MRDSDGGMGAGGRRRRGGGRPWRRIFARSGRAGLQIRCTRAGAPAGPGALPANLAQFMLELSMHLAGQALDAGWNWNRGWPSARGGSRGPNVGGHSAPFYCLRSGPRRPVPRPRGDRGARSGRFPQPFETKRKARVDTRAFRSRPQCGAEWAPTPDGDGTGGIRDSSPGADIEACAYRKRPNAT